MRIASLIPLFLFVPLFGCAETGSDYAPPPEGALGASGLVREGPGEGSPEDAVRPRDTGLRVVFLGTSLTEGYGLSVPEREAWPARIGEMAAAAGRPIQVVNAGASGETSAGAVRRLPWILRQSLDVLVVETGANDGLRALPVSALEANLDAILSAVRAASPTAKVAIVEMLAPPNLGAAYTQEFNPVFARVAERWDAALVPFPLDGVAGVPRLNQSDGIHPTAEGHRIMAENAWPVIDTLLREP